MSSPARVPGSNEFLVVGLGVRFLAESARKAGLRVTSLDAFADQDTAAAARAVRSEHATAEGLTQAALKLGSPGIGLVYGGGFEGRADLLERLALRFCLFGNPPSVAALAANPKRFYSLLETLAIPHPETRLTHPEDPHGWLVKRGASCGGAGVRAADDAERFVSAPDSFFQRRVSGPIFSVLFAANGVRARIIGYSRLFSEFRRDRPYAYAGAMTWNGPDAAARETIGSWVQRLVEAIGLEGINGLDLVLTGSGPLVLELNARPVATLELHADRLPDGVMAAHLAACARCLPKPVPEPSDIVRGYRVIYADRSFVVPLKVWPAWVRDRPRWGEQISQDAPLCTVHATGRTGADLENRLRARALYLLSVIDQEDIQAA